MYVIADSGSTKTDWRLIDGQQIHPVRTIGFNPYFIEKKAIIEELERSDLKIYSKSIESVFFYGAGCASKEKKTKLKAALKGFFVNSTIQVEHDLLGAARATCGRNPGMVGILGTGSNSCLYDGVQISEHIASLGYILGDEGSGTNIGKQFIRSFLYNELPLAIADKFDKKYKLTRDDILTAVYKDALPNRFLASFALFVGENLSDPFLLNMVEECFRQYFQKHISRYSKKISLHIVGGIAETFYSVIKRIGKEEYDIDVLAPTKRPIDGLVDYHQVDFK